MFAQSMAGRPKG
jgi:hypothetical protein